jgi:hypothetical protein
MVPSLLLGWMKNNFSVPIQEGMWGSGGPNPNDNGWVTQQVWDISIFSGDV